MSHNMRRREGLDYFMVHKTHRKSNRQCASEALGQLQQSQGTLSPLSTFIIVLPLIPI